MLNFLEDDIILLRPLEIEDVEGDYPDWLNDAESSTGNNHHRFPYTRDQARSYIEEVNRSRNSVVLAITDKSTKQHLGNIALQGICWISRSAEFAILIGSASSRGRGIGYRAGILLIGHGFNELNLHRIYCGTYSNNTAMKALASKLGMSHVGTLRQSAFKGGQFVNEELFDILRSEYDS